MKSTLNRFNNLAAIVALVIITALLTTMSPVIYSQANLRQPTVSSTGLLNVTWTAGTVNNGGHAVAITAGSTNATASRTDCAAPTYTTCGWIYANSSGTVSNTTTLATAATTGNTILAMYESNGTVITKLSFPLQNSMVGLAGLGITNTIGTAITPTTAGGATVGTALLPFSSLFLGATASNSFQLTGTATGNLVFTLPDTASDTFVMRTATQTLTNKTLTAPVIGAATGTSLDLTGSLDVGVAGTTVGTVVMNNATSGTVTLSPTTGALGTVTATFPAASITVPGTIVNNCGTANACSNTVISSTSKIVVGVTAALDGASPAVATVTGMPAFTSNSSYVCTASLTGAGAATPILAVNRVSSSSVSFVATNGATATVQYICIGS